MDCREEFSVRAEGVVMRIVIMICLNAMLFATCAFLPGAEPQAEKAEEVDIAAVVEAGNKLTASVLTKIDALLP